METFLGKHLTATLPTVSIHPQPRKPDLFSLSFFLFPVPNYNPFSPPCPLPPGPQDQHLAAAVVCSGSQLLTGRLRFLEKVPGAVRGLSRDITRLSERAYFHHGARGLDLAQGHNLKVRAIPRPVG